MESFNGSFESRKSGNPYPKSWAFSPKREDEDMQELILAFQGVLEEKMKLLPEPFPMSMARI